MEALVVVLNEYHVRLRLYRVTQAHLSYNHGARPSGLRCSHEGTEGDDCRAECAVVIADGGDV